MDTFHQPMCQRKIFRRRLLHPITALSRTGVQVSPAMANLAIKAWRLVFTAGILDLIVKHTNKYGYQNAKQLVPHHQEGPYQLHFSSIFDVHSEEKGQAFELVLQ
jgi:hypothetical protein